MVNRFAIKKNNETTHVVDIYFNDQEICLVNWNKELGELEIVFYPHERMNEQVVFLIQDFLDALREAQKNVLQSVNRDSPKS